MAQYVFSVCDLPQFAETRMATINKNLLMNIFMFISMLHNFHSEQVVFIKFLKTQNM